MISRGSTSPACSSCRTAARTVLAAASSCSPNSWAWAASSSTIRTTYPSPSDPAQPSRAAADRDPIPVPWGLLPWSRTLIRLQLLDRVAAPLQAGRERAVVSTGVLLRRGLLLLRLLPLVAIGAALTGATGHGAQLGATFHGIVGAAVL